MAHGGKGARRRYLERKGLLQPKASTYSRSENGLRYQYSNRIANKFAGWSSVQRDAGKVPLFGNFYNGLDQEDQNSITITEIFKTTQ